MKSEGRKLFLTGATPPCALCHTLADAGATGEIGPVLDEMKPDAAQVEKAIRHGLGVMPANTNLSDAQIKLLAEYVARVTGGAAN
jgi:mono/diheme cytochrome c family protein